VSDAPETQPPVTSAEDPGRAPPNFISSADLQRFTRMLHRTLGTRFRLAIIETPDLQSQTEVLDWLHTMLTGRGVPLFDVNLHRLWKPQEQWPDGTANVWKTLHREIDPAAVSNHHAVIVVRGLESFQDIAGEARWDVARQFNIQRELYVRDFPCWWILLLHPTSRLHWQKVAPDFCDFVSVWTHAEPAPGIPAETAVAVSQTADIEALPAAGAPAGWSRLLLNSLRSLQHGHLDQALDSLYSFRAAAERSSHSAAISTILEALIREQRGETSAAAELLSGTAIPRLRTLNAHHQCPVVLADLAWALCSAARLSLVRGNLISSRSQLLEGHELWAQLHTLDSEDPRVRAELANSFELLGDIARISGRLTDARDAWNESLLLRQNLRQQFPEQPEYEAAIAGSYNRLSANSLTTGNSDIARDYAERALEIAARIATSQPENPEASRNHAVQCEQLGDLLMLSGAVESAEPLFLQATEINRRLIAVSPESTHYFVNLSTNLIKLADLALRRRQFDIARRQLEEALKICRKLAAIAPADVLPVRLESICQERLGDLYVAIGSYHRAKTCCEKSLATAEQLAEQSPENTEFARDVSICLNKLADLLMADHDLSAAQELYERSFRIRERLSAAAPENVQFLQDLRTSCLKLAQLYTSRQQPELAGKFISRAAELGQNLVQGSG